MPNLSFLSWEAKKKAGARQSSPAPSLHISTPPVPVKARGLKRSPRGGGGSARGGKRDIAPPKFCLAPPLAPSTFIGKNEEFVYLWIQDPKISDLHPSKKILFPPFLGAAPSLIYVLLRLKISNLHPPLVSIVTNEILRVHVF